jgi:hypothetical protein
MVPHAQADILRSKVGFKLQDKEGGQLLPKTLSAFTSTFFLSAAERVPAFAC